MAGSSLSARAYLELAKPERTLTNVLTAAAGFFFAAKRPVDWMLLVALLAGSTLIIASACVFNNCLDHRLDAKMDRTSRRVLVKGQVSLFSAGIYATILGIAGFVALAFTNRLTFVIGMIAFAGYVGLYGWAKRHTPYSTLIGTLPGGASLVAGYTAVTGRLDGAAALLFIVMAAWQMVHFYAIAIYRLKDYKAASLPVWPVRYGVAATKYQMIFFALVFAAAVIMMSILGYTGYVFFVVMGLTALYLLWLVLFGKYRHDDAHWAKSIFKTSLVVITVLAIMLAIGPHLP